jgi:hypothetical protein
MAAREQHEHVNVEMAENEGWWGGKCRRLAGVVGGIIIGQFLLYGQSFIGKKVLLPLDALAVPTCYLPATAPAQSSSRLDKAFTDVIMVFEPDRLFAVREFKAGRFPMWTPYEYGGAPFIAPKYSPFFLLTCLTESPVVLAWAQLLAALVAGTGAYAFCRRVLGVSFWPATLAAWCYPMTGYFVLWQGSPTCAAAYWLPWLLLAVDRTVRGNQLAAMALALVSGLVVVSGHIDVGGQVLLVSGLYALWCLWDVYRPPLARRTAAKGVLILALAWSLGLMLAAPQVMPLVEYAKTGARLMERQVGGFEARPPLGLAALPQIVLPDMYGSTQRGSAPVLLKGMVNLPESAAATYTGLLATLLVAPWAWYSRRHRSMNVFWLFLAVFGLSWTLDMPGIVDVLRLPGLNLMSHNRLVFATSLAILAMTAIGLEALLQGLVRWRWQLGLQLALLVGLFGWCLYRAEILPEPLASQLEKVVGAQGRFDWITNVDGVKQAQTWFRLHYGISATLCAAAVIVWLISRSRRAGRRSLFAAVSILLLGDLICFSYGRSPQCDPALHFPEIPALRDVVKAATGRIVGYKALPANLAQAVGLKDVRGYDAVDPGRWVALLEIAADENSPAAEHARLQFMVPRLTLPPADTLQLSPVLDMVGVQFVIFRGQPPPGVTPKFQSPDYWILENQSAQPRAFVPRQVEVVADGNQMLYQLGLPEFDPRKVAYVEEPVSLPSECRGNVRVTEEIPTRIVANAQMETPGLMVLADSWNAGWRAYLNGRSVRILRTNYAVRGVVLPAGSATIEFRYQPASATCGFCLAGGAAVILLGWLGIVLWSRRERARPQATTAKPPAS